MRYFIFLLLLVTVSAQGQVIEPTQPASLPPAVCPPCPEPEVKKDTQYYRDQSFGQFMVGYQYADTWVPGKATASYTQILTRGWSLELEYAGSKKDIKIVDTRIGDVKEERYTFLGKFYIGNSFHFSFGPFFRNIKIETEGRLKKAFGDRFNDELEFETWGAALAFGNRWQTRWGLTYGVDWLRVNIPLKDGKVEEKLIELNEDSQRNVGRVSKVIRRLPAFSLIGVNIGYTF